MDQRKDGRKPELPDDTYTHNIRKDGERKLDRRSFMKLMVGAAGIFAVSTLPWGAIAARELAGIDKKAYEKIKITDLDQIGIGEAVKFAYPHEHDSALLVRVAEHQFYAYQNACTHLKCPVFWGKEEERLVCPCHHGFFDVTTGKPSGGPPKRPLPAITLETSGGAVYATGVKPYES